MRLSFTRRLQAAEARAKQQAGRQRGGAEGRAVTPEEAEAAYSRMNREVAEAWPKLTPLAAGEAIRIYERMLKG